MLRSKESRDWMESFYSHLFCLKEICLCDMGFKRSMDENTMRAPQKTSPIPLWYLYLQLPLSCSLNVQYFLPGWLQFPPAEVSPLSSLVVPVYTSQFCKDVFLTFNSAYIIPLLTISNNFPWIKLRLLSLPRGCHECASACPSVFTS